MLVKSGNEFNVLYLAGSKINYSDFDIGGSLDGSDLKLYAYTDKGYYRPGDEINVSLIARSKEKWMTINLLNTHLQDQMVQLR